MKKLFNRKFPFVYQTNSMDCGLACLLMIARYFGKRISLERLRAASGFEITGVSMYGLKLAAETIHLEATGVVASINKVKELVAQLPVIVHWKGDHFVVVFEYKNGFFTVADPAKGILKMNDTEFSRFAVQGEQGTANLLILESTEAFLNIANDKEDRHKLMRFFVGQVKQFKIFYLFIVWALLLGLVVQFLLPFFTKNVVDLGVQSGSIRYVGYLLAGQLVLIGSATLFSVLRSWITLHLASRVNYSLVSGFLNKLFRVPLNFFETRKIGDILQRISDHSRIEMFVTRTTLGVLFSAFTVIIYSGILAYFHFGFFVLLFITVASYALWISIFLKKRKQIDWRRFELSARNQSNIIQIVNGIHDLKINGAEGKYFSKWDKNQHEVIENSFDNLKLFQLQEVGATLIFQLSQLGITFLSVYLAINNSISFGTMLSIQFIMGQLILPIQQLLGVITAAQDARLSYDRLHDVWAVKDESQYSRGDKLIESVKNPSIHINDLYFSYPGQDQSKALRNVSMDIASGQITAIVGLSGSGKTSILKLLLGYYHNYEGMIKVGDQNFRDIDLEQWRSRCGVVLQESFIFNDTIAENVCMNQPFNEAKLREALKVANILDFVESLPMSYNTMIGSEGKGLSQGQKQRILIARTVYKDPDYVFFDEATNALDAENESIIINNLKKFFVGKTVVLIAHRLSTIQFADNIILLQNGEIIERGCHSDLKEQKGQYFDLVKKQMTA